MPCRVGVICFPVLLFGPFVLLSCLGDEPPRKLPGKKKQVSGGLLKKVGSFTYQTPQENQRNKSWLFKKKLFGK